RTPGVRRTDELLADRHAAGHAFEVRRIRIESLGAQSPVHACAVLPRTVDCLRGHRRTGRTRYVLSVWPRIPEKPGAAAPATACHQSGRIPRRLPLAAAGRELGARTTGRRRHRLVWIRAYAARAAASAGGAGVAQLGPPP